MSHPEIQFLGRQIESNAIEFGVVVTIIGMAILAAAFAVLRPARR
jgi:Flp pilus assembly pilin Flp